MEDLRDTLLLMEVLRYTNTDGILERYTTIDGSLEIH